MSATGPETGQELVFGMLNRVAFRLAGWQLGVVGLVTVLAAWLGGAHAAMSAATGGGIGIVAGLYQAIRMFRTDASLDPGAYMGVVYLAEAVKIFLTVALFIFAIKVLRVEFAPAIVGYATTFFVYWAALKTNYPWNTKADGSELEKGSDRNHS